MNSNINKFILLNIDSFDSVDSVDDCIIEI